MKEWTTVDDEMNTNPEWDMWQQTPNLIYDNDSYYSQPSGIRLDLPLEEPTTPKKHPKENLMEKFNGLLNEAVDNVKEYSSEEESEEESDGESDGESDDDIKIAEGVMVDKDEEDDTSDEDYQPCLLYTSPSPRDLSTSRMPSSA